MIQMSERAYLSGLRGRPWLMGGLVCWHVLLVWLVSPIWVAVLVTVFWILFFAYGWTHDG